MTSNTSGDIVYLLASTLRPPEFRRIREIPECGGPRPRRGCGHRGRTHQQQGDRRRADRRGGAVRAVLGSVARMLTARAATSATVSSEASAWTSIRAFANRVRGSTSVGLNAAALVKAT